MEIVDRLIMFRDQTGLSNSQFADQAGIPRPTLSQFLNGRNKRLSDEFVAKLHQAYPNLNVMWLLFGEGDMEIDGNIEFSEGSQVQNGVSQSAENTENKVVESLPLGNSGLQTATANYKIDDKEEPDTYKNSTFDQNQNLPPVIPTDPHKTIRSIMVFYSDNSYESFVPANTSKD